MSHRLLRSLAPFCLAATLAVPARAQRAEAGGIFVDRAGKQHPWVITGTHAVVWDRQPWVPVGGTFAPHYLAEAPTEENWKLDVAGLEALKARGVLDILVDPVRPAVDVAPAAWQRLVDYLDGAGFRYGIGFGAGLAKRLNGFVIRPSAYRVAGPREGADTTWKVPDADSAYFVVADAGDASGVAHEGRVPVQDGVAIVPAQPRTGQGSVILLYPHGAAPARREGALPDLWAAYDAYRDRVLAVLSGVKFGPGLRFFLDPLAHPLGIFGDAQYIVPDSPGFRAEWETWLSTRYATVDDVARAWALTDEVKDFRAAAQLIPLWDEGRGMAYMLDPTSGKRFEARVDDSRFWLDLRACRNEAIGYYLNAMADVLKQNVANVPVVYTRTQHYSIFTNTKRSGGFDGLGVAAYDQGSALVTGGADSVYSQCEESARPMWCLVSETLDTAGTKKGQVGYGSRDALFYDLDWLRGMGAKGFFVNGFQVLPEQPNPDRQLLKAPEQIAWIKEYADRLQKQFDLALSRPRVLPYPTAAAGLVHSGPIGNGGVLWVPSLAPGHALEFGSSFAGYTIALPDGDATVLWSKQGAREVHLQVPDPMRASVVTAEGEAVKAKLDAKRKTLQVTLAETPLIIKGAGQEVFPIEAAEEALAQLRGLVAMGTAKSLPVEDFRYRMEHAETNLRHRDYKVAYAMAIEGLNGIVQVVRPFIWREAESADQQSFSEVTANEAASGGGYLALNAEARPGRSGYGATWKFGVPADDTYNVWVACTPPGPRASPFTWCVDDSPQVPAAQGTTVGLPYIGNTFVWVRLGRMRMAKGDHSLDLHVTDLAPGLGKYFLNVDAVLITPSEFTPNGISKPSLQGLSAKDAPKAPPRRTPPPRRRR